MSRFFSSKFKDLTPYVPGEQPQNRKFIKLNTNESPYAPSPKAKRYAAEAALDLQLYSDPECRALIKAGAEFFGVAEENMIFSNGSDEVLNFAFMAYCDEQTKAVFPEITYGFYPVFAALNRIPFEEIPLKEDLSVDTEAFMNCKKTVFIANPNAPTGLALGSGAIEKIIASNKDNVVVIDEAYVDFGAESVVPLTAKYDNLLVIGTFSKSRSLAGGRLGYAIGNAALIKDLNTIRFSTNPYNINRMTAAAGIGALEDTEYFNECRNRIISTRERITKELRDLGFELTDSSANFLFARHPSVSGEILYTELRKKGILVRHFGLEKIKDYLRITIGSDSEMDVLVSAFKQILGEKK